MINQLSVLLTHPLCHTKNTFLVGNDRISGIAMDKFRETFDLLDDCISTLHKFECGKDTISMCPLLQVDKSKQAKL